MHAQLMRRAVRSAIASMAIVSLPLLIVGAAGANGFGMRAWDISPEYGSISSISVPSSTQQPANNYGMYLHRSGMLSNLGGGNLVGQIQAGWATLGIFINLDTCGNTASATVEFMEYSPVNSGTYTCHFFNYHTYPYSENFNVFVNSNGWYDKIGGVLDPNGPYHLNGMPNGFPFIGGESAFTGATGPAATCYGQGPSDWEYYPSNNNGGPGSIPITNNSSTTTALTNGWTIGPVPTPLCDNFP